MLKLIELVKAELHDDFKKNQYITTLFPIKECIFFFVCVDNTVCV